MRRILVIAAIATLAGMTTAYGQEGGGAGRIEIGAFPGGGVFFNGASNDTEPNFGDYALGAALTFNVNRWFGVEGEIGSAVGVKQTLDFRGDTLINQKSPSLLAYSGNVVVSPFRSDRRFVPYGAAGLGGLRLLKSDGVANLGVTSHTDYFMSNVGGGLKWFAARHWGLRGDYRLMMVNDTATAPEFFGHSELRFGHRVYGGLLLTY